MSTIPLDKQIEMIKMMFVIASLLAVTTTTINTSFATSNEYHVGYKTGCDDTTATQKAIIESDGLSDQFKLGYEHGYLECSGFDRSTFNCEEGSNGCDGLVYCSKIDNDVVITCYDEAD